MQALFVMREDAFIRVESAFEGRQSQATFTGETTAHPQQNIAGALDARVIRLSPPRRDRAIPSRTTSPSIRSSPQPSLHRGIRRKPREALNTLAGVSPVKVRTSITALWTAWVV